MLLDLLYNTCISCINKEGMSNVLYSTSNGVHNDKYQKVYEPGENYEKVSVPMEEGQLFYYGNNDLNPNVASILLSGTGDARETGQKSYLASRAGNKAGRRGILNFNCI